jgi:tctex1 domain-containing protein 2
MSNNTEYKIRPPFKAKFRNAEARPLIEKVVADCLLQVDADTSVTAKLMADKVKDTLKGLKKDERYKYIVQVTLGENNGQGMRCGSRNYWDEDTDDVCYVS